MTDLGGQVALVTGASAGLGFHFAKLLAGAGARVALVARRRERLEEAVAEIESAGGQAIAIPADVADAQSLPDVVQQAESALGLVTILVNNAGIPDAKLATRMPLALIDSVIDINVRAPFVLSCEVARRLIAEKQPGRIVNMASISAFQYPGKGAALYATTKAAIVRMTEALSTEWAGFDINVNAIAPGSFRSEMMDGMIARIGDVAQDFPRKRLGDPADLDSTLLYLLSPQSRFVTGTCIKVDDGQFPK